jgi:predicted glycoside hydrolase/deacetylase ChbG (UPF0249 family)
VGLHIDLGEWAYRNGEWVELYSVAPIDDADEVGAEVARQFVTFRRLMRAAPTHVDSHQHVHRSAPVDAVVRELGARLGVPVRHRARGVAHLGTFYGQNGTGTRVAGAITPERLIEIVRTIPAGVTELGCHPGLRGDAPGMYVAERDEEVRALCDPRVRAAIEEERIELMSFRELPSV